MTNLKAPFPYFGGKSAVADIVWKALGDCGHYIEPFCGSAAVLLARPGFQPHIHVETVNDADGHIANVWRALQADPDEVAKWCDWPVNHADLMARKRRINAETETLLDNLVADDTYYNPLLAGYYIWAASCWIGAGLVCPGQIPHLGTAGMGVHVKGQIPQLGNAGKGVHAKGKIPHLSSTGKGVHTKHNTNTYAWFRTLSERLRYVRVVCGDWSRVCGGKWQTGPGKPCGMFFDPPYSDPDRCKNVYGVDSMTVAHDVREWCKTRADDPDYRIVLAGYDGEHNELEDIGWTVHAWKAQGGYGNQAGKDAGSQGQVNRHKERLWLSPHCNDIHKGETRGLF